jgi:hypothetical protein
LGGLLTHQTFTAAKLVKVCFYNFGSLFQYSEQHSKKLPNNDEQSKRRRKKGTTMRNQSCYKEIPRFRNKDTSKCHYGSRQLKRDLEIKERHS